MSDKYKQAAEYLINLSEKCFDAEDERKKSEDYLRATFPPVLVAEGVRELVTKIRETYDWNLPTMTDDAAAALIQSYIDAQAESIHSLYLCRKDCISYYNEIGCSSCVRKANDNFIGVKHES